MRRLLSSSIALLVLCSAPLRAQDAVPDTLRALAPIARPANDSLFRRARRLVGEGSGAAGRALVDSLLRAASEGTPAYGDALYWRGALQETATDAERDYRRVIVEYPLAYYMDDALLAIAELEQARGDRAGALQHLQRFVREHPVSPARGVAALGAARLAFEQHDTRTGCAMVNEARASMTAGTVEIRNQLAPYEGRCPALPAPRAVVAARPAPSTPVPAIAERPAAPRVAAPKTAAPARAEVSNDSAGHALQPSSTRPSTSLPAAPMTLRRDSARTQAAHSARAGTHTIQLAAYNTKAEAERLVTKLASRGVHARVSGSSKPFRVRLGFFGTPGEAATEVAALKARGIIGFVTTESPTP